MSRRVTLLGPQRRPSLQQVTAELPRDTRVALVNAGWQEREPDDGELREIVGLPTVNLGLYRRWRSLHEQDRELGHAEREHQAALAELRQLYLTQLDHALAAAYEIARRSDARPRLRARALDDALAAVQLLDSHHVARTSEAQEAFYAAWRPQERDALAEHRDQVRQALTEADVLVVAGGHVGELVALLHLFHVEPHLPHTLIAWSAGAMALADRVVLFHDFVPHGVSQAEVWSEGLGILPDLVPLPHARRRLRTDDRIRMSVLARRFAPATCLVLDDGVQVPLRPGGELPPEARVLGRDGRISAGGTS